MTDYTYSVTEITTTIREIFESDERLQDVWVSGEISNLTRASSGHWYFTLKDSAAQLRCVMWRSAALKQTTIPRDGDAIVAHGRVSVYEPRGEYQLYADEVRPVGLGDLYQRFEELKRLLEAEGLFDAERKRPIPLFPRCIGVVTSPEAAAFQDIQNVLRRRFPIVKVILSPTIVQGAEAPPQIVRALERLNQNADVDVILVCRGGGSIEDLWAFNDERVARAIAASRVPVISGVGHETDFTIADFAADLRAPTPSAAAEIATPNMDDLREAIRRVDSQLIEVMDNQLYNLKNNLIVMQRSLRLVSPESDIQTFRQRVDDMNARIVTRQRNFLALLRERLTARERALFAANPDAILARGYAIVTRSEDGQRIKAEADAPSGTGITITLQDGELKARVEDKAAHERYKRTLF
jgi:exodeoxyribonuclease VII large subunit